MAILKTYPLKSNYYGSDRIILSDMEPDSQGIVHGNTKNLTLSSLKNFVGSNLDGSGTANTIPKWSDSNTLTDSPFTIDTSINSLDIPSFIRHIGDTDSQFGFLQDNHFRVNTGGQTTIQSISRTDELGNTGQVAGLYFNSSQRLFTRGGGVEVEGSIYMPGYIRHLGDNDSLFGFSGPNNFILNTDSGTKIAAGPAGVTLYSDTSETATTTSVKRFETTTTGAIVYGQTVAAGAASERGGIIRYYNNANDRFVGISGPVTQGTNYQVRLPDSVGTAGQVLTLNNPLISGQTQDLVWSSPAGTGTVIGSGTTNYIPKWNSSTELTDSIVVSGASNISVSGVRPISMNSATGAIDIKGPNAGWATGYLFTGSSGTNLGGFGALGSSDTLSYYWIGDAYDDITMVVQPNGGNVGIGTSNPTAKLQVNGNLKLKYPTSSGTFTLEPNSSNNSQYSLILPTIPSSSDGSKFLQLPSSTTGLQQFQLEWADPRLQVATNINKTRSLNPGNNISMTSTDNGLNVTISSTGGGPGTGNLDMIPYWSSTTTLGSSQLKRLNSNIIEVVNGNLKLSNGVINLKQASGPSVTLGGPTTAGTDYWIKLPQIPTVAAGYTGGMGLKLPDTLGSSPFQLEWQQPNTKFKDVNSRPFIDGNLTGGISMQQGTGPTIKLEATSNAGPATTYLLPPASQSQAGYVLTLPTGTITSPYQLAWTNASSVTSTNNVTASANSLNLQGSSSVAPTYGAPLNISSSGGTGSGNQTAIYIDQAATANAGGSQGVRMNFKLGSIGILVTNADSQFAKVASFKNASNQVVGDISCTSIATTYATSSDYRIKENVVDMTGAVDRVKQLKPSRFNFTADPSKIVDGFLAHEAQEVVPESVTGVKDALYPNGDPLLQGIDQSKIVPLLTGAIKELIARIEELEAK